MAHPTCLQYYGTVHRSGAPYQQLLNSTSRSHISLSPLVKSPLGASMHAQVLVDSRLHREPDEIYQREPDEFLGGVSQWQIAK